MSRLFQSFAVRAFRIWIIAVTVSNVGTWMQRTAQDWLILTELTDHDAAAVGIATALQFGPQLLLSPLTGLVSDRVDRRRVLFATQLSMGVLALALGILTVAGLAELWMVLLFSLALGVATAFDNPARATFIGDLVPADSISNALGLNALSFNIARLIGPAVAGLLTAAIGSGWVFVINAGTFMATLCGLLLLGRRLETGQERAEREPGQIRAGFAYIRSRNDLVLVFVIVALVGTFGMNFPVFVSTMSVHFGASVEGFGLLTSAMAFGSLGGAVLAARRRTPRLRTITISCLCFGIGTGLAAVAPGIVVFGALLAIVGAFVILTFNTANAYVQTTTGPTLRGRVMSLYMAIFLGSALVGAPIAGWIANAASPRWAMLVGAASAFVAAGIAGISYVRIRRLRLRWHPTRRWPLRFESGDHVANRALATAEVTVTETERER